MLNRNINSIIQQSYFKLGELSYEIAIKIQEGEAGKALDKLWNKIVQLDQLLDMVASHIEVQNNSVYRVVGMTSEEMNRILSCLVKLANIYDYPISTFVITKDISNISIGDGAQGPPGKDGVSSYNAIAFASDNIGTNFSTTPDISRPYVAFLTMQSPIPLIASSFTGKWIKFIGDAGADGIDGEDGITFYPYIRFASDDQGTNFSPTPSSSRRFIAFLYTTTNYNGNPSSTLFDGLWVEYIGKDGINGQDGEDGNTILITSGIPAQEIGKDGDVALDTTNWYIYAPKLAGQWPAGHSLTGPQGIPGTDGINGSPGTNGINGVSSYIYIAYATDPSGSNYNLVLSSDPSATVTAFDSSKEWIGIIVSQTPIGNTINSSNFAGNWTRYQGSGDRWTTYSNSTLTIGTGSRTLTVEHDLAYSVGQTVVIADPANFANRMEAYVSAYNPLSGIMIVNVANAVGSGTFSQWAVSLQAFSSDPPTTYGGASPSTITVNDLPSGTSITGKTYDELFEHIYAPFINPAFSAFAMSGQAQQVEVGTTISGSKTFTWATTNSGNVAPNTIQIKDQTTNTVLLTGAADDGSEAGVAIGSVIHTSPAVHTWRILGTDNHSNVFTRDFNVSWLWLKYWGTSNNVTLTEAQIEALANTALSSTPNQIYSLAAGGYKYFVWDDSLGSPIALTGFRDTSTNLAVAMATSADDAAYSNVQNGWYYALVSVTNAQGQTSNKRVYRTKNILGGTINIQVS